MWRYLLPLLAFVGLDAQETKFYDTFYGEPLTKQDVVRHGKENTTFWCTIEVAPCDPDEGRRVDGTCNNLRHPPRGGSHTPFIKLMDPEFSEGFEPRLSETGEPLPNARRLRTTLLNTGTRPDLRFTQLATHFSVFMVADVATVHDSVNYVLWKPYCCQAKGKTDPECTPQPIENDDPVHRFSDIRCLNLTRPMSYQSTRCINNGTAPDKITSSTPTIDLSTVYGNDLKNSLEKTRLFKGGLLKSETVDGRIFPPSVQGNVSVCMLNQPPHETRCHNTGEDGINSLLGINLFGIWFWRNHNRIATALSEMNPCWSDAKLYAVARDINIAVFTQITYYEFWPLFIGWDHLLRNEIVSKDPGFRDYYDEEKYPQISSEYVYVMRWFHLMQEGRLKMYDQGGTYMKQIPIVNVTLRTGYLALDNNLDYITQGSFRQASAKMDFTIDPEIGESILGGLQRASDVGTSDIAKGRYFGFPSYIKYRKYCSGYVFDLEDFDELEDLIDPDRVELLRELYKDVKDVELLAGIWMENPFRGAIVPPTFFCIVTEQLILSLEADRHWYERQNRPNAFTLPQLLEVRKATVSQLLCDVGDQVTEIQPHGFLRAGPNNTMVDCSKIPKMDLSKWKDETCNSCKA